MTLQQKLDKFMTQNNYKSLKQLAIDSGIPYTTLKDFYKKNSLDNSRLSTARTLSKFMNCMLDYLAYDEIEDPTQTIDNHISEINEEYPYTKTISDEDGFSIEIKTPIPFNSLPQQEQQEMIDNAMEELLKVKKEARQKDNN